mgnify:FL=1
MKDEVFDALTRWGELGHACALHYGLTMHDGRAAIGWQCFIHFWSQGSISIGSLGPIPNGFHPTSAHEAARTALRQAAEQWPEMAEKARV